MIYNVIIHFGSFVLVGSTSSTISFEYLRHELDDQKNNKWILPTYTFRHLFHKGQYFVFIFHIDILNRRYLTVDLQNSRVSITRISSEVKISSAYVFFFDLQILH